MERIVLYQSLIIIAYIVINTICNPSETIKPNNETLEPNNELLEPDNEIHLIDMSSDDQNIIIEAPSRYNQTTDEINEKHKHLFGYMRYWEEHGFPEVCPMIDEFCRNKWRHQCPPLMNIILAELMRAGAYRTELDDGTVNYFHWKNDRNAHIGLNYRVMNILTNVQDQAKETYALNKHLDNEVAKIKEHYQN